MDNETTIGERHDAARELITTGHVWRVVWYVAWPTAVTTLIQTAYNLINRAFLGHLPNATDVALAAVGIGGGFLMMQMAFMLGIGAGTSALVSRFIGARQYQDAEETTRQALILSVIGGIVTAIPLIVFAAPLFRLVGVQHAVVPQGADYLIIISAASIPAFLYWTITSALRSIGDMRTPLYAGAIMIAINGLLDWPLILGIGHLHVNVNVFHVWRLVLDIGPIHGLGVHGAAISTVISKVVGLAFALWFLHRSALGGALSHFRPHKVWFSRLMAIGIPATLQNLMWTSAYMGFMWVLGRLAGDASTNALAALTVALAIESTSFMPGAAYSVAVTPLVGQNLGAGKPERAEHSAWVATGQAVAIMSLVAVLFIVIPEQLARLFTNKPNLVPLIASYLRINGLSEPFLALGMVLRGALQGAGDVKVPAGIAALTLWVVRMPLAWMLAIHLHYGATGAWVAMAATTVLSGILTVVWFRWGPWRTIEV